ncbi:hypothetical protein DL93DRAFT_2092165 [Clavulina sp. PMI_390]|nr:hypothetical protein DL93DRAFT_2092165 [Clavulina sp. PMI_390]
MAAESLTLSVGGDGLIHKLPTELLRIIFDFCKWDDDAGDTNLTDTTQPLSNIFPISSVCSRWRSIASGN